MPPEYKYRVKNTVDGSEFEVTIQASKEDADEHMKFTYPHPVYIVTQN